MRFKLTIFFLLAITACGPRPEIQIEHDNTPEGVWDRYSARFQNINSFAISGSFTITEKETHEFKLQLIYVAPDSFAFLAEGTLGVDLARGAIVGDSGFWEIPRDNFIEQLKRNDYILFGESEIPLDISVLLEAIFFFIPRAEFIYQGQEDSRFIYSNGDGSRIRKIEISRDSATPVRQIFTDPVDMVYVEYYDWQTGPDNSIFPGRIMVKSPTSGIDAEYLVKKTKINPANLKTNFLPKL